MKLFDPRRRAGFGQQTPARTIPPQADFSARLDFKPVRPGDTLSVRVTVLKAVPSKSKPDRGAVTSFVEVIDQASEVVMRFKPVNIIAKRSPKS
jgi:hypothetical protein